MKLYTESELDELEELEALQDAIAAAEAREDGMRHTLMDGHIII